MRVSYPHILVRWATISDPIATSGTVWARCGLNECCSATTSLYIIKATCVCFRCIYLHLGFYIECTQKNLLLIYWAIYSTVTESQTVTRFYCYLT